MNPVAVARQAMATRFEIVLYGDDPIALRAAGEDALSEIERLEQRLSLYRASSDISRINDQAASGPVRIDPALFQLLQRAQRLSHETGGAFDITVAPLIRCWGFMQGSGSMPTVEQIDEARSRVGMHRVQLNENDFTVQFEREGMMFDLGAIGKGYALERAAESLEENGVTSALLHGGTSTVYGLGTPPEGEWKIAIEPPPKLSPPDALRAASSKAVRPLATVVLQNAALSVSAPHGKSFMADGKVYGHVIDPRTGYPAQGALLAAVIVPSVAESDALSTALLTLGVDGHEMMAKLRPGIETMVVGEDKATGRLQIRSQGQFALAQQRP